jgi:murein L,D-transpeptidase YcbB/YkuD
MTLLGTSEVLGNRTLVLGMQGPDVVELMLLLVKKEFLQIDSVNTKQLFTKQVENAVKSFQRSKGLNPDGKVGSVSLLLLKDPE